MPTIEGWRDMDQLDRTTPNWNVEVGQTLTVSEQMLEATRVAWQKAQEAEWAAHDAFLQAQQVAVELRVTIDHDGTARRLLALQG